MCHITEGSTTTDVDFNSCVPMCLSRDLCDNAVYRLKAFLNGNNTENQKGSALTGMVSGVPTSILVPLVKGLAYVGEEYLFTLYDNPADIEVRKAKHKV